MSSGSAVVAAALVIAGAACGVRSPEEQILTDWFQAARQRDTTMVARVSDVDFHPRAEGVVEEFEVEDSRSLPGNGDARLVILAARVRRPDGSTHVRQLMVTLRREAGGRWRVTDLAA